MDLDYTLDRKEKDAVTIKINEKVLKGRKSDAMKVLFKELEKEGIKEANLDFSNVNIIDSSGIGKVLVFYQALKKSGGKVKITGISVELKGFFEALHLDKIFSL